MVMGVFGVATIPVLLAIGFTASFIQKHNLRKMAQVVAGWVIMVYGIWYLYRGYLFVFTQGPACH
jgi:sulfite exporter TauE/SafE